VKTFDDHASARLYKWVPVILILFVASLLRLYRIFETIRFRGDNGYDLIIIWNMEFAHRWPLVGPYLSIEHFYTPPTYYYITWFFYHLSHSVFGVITGYFLLNIVTLILLMATAYRMAGKRVSLLLGAMFAVSATMITHGRQFWQPYPMQFFLASFIWCVWIAFEKRHFLWLLAGLTSYQLALSVYPSPALLAPYVIYQLFRWHRERHLSGIRSFLASIGLFMLTLGIVFSPQLYFEFTHGYPSIHALLSQPIGPYIIDEYVFSIGDNIQALFNAFIPFNSFLPTSAEYPAFALALLLIFITDWHTVASKTRRFLAPGWLMLGFTLFFFFHEEAYGHRTEAYLPFVFLYVAIVLTKALEKRRRTAVIGAGILLVYLAVNISSSVSNWIGTPATDEFSEARRVATYIEKDALSRKIPTGTTFGLVQRTPPGMGDNFYDVFRVAYFLVEHRVMTINPSKEGNMVAYSWFNPDPKPIMYFICRNYASQKAALDNCVIPSEKNNPYAIRAVQTIGFTYVFIGESERQQQDQLPATGTR
jgi:4-amino-4-deoxy-L-arabinose transferase-like glycosyltransferase